MFSVLIQSDFTSFVFSPMLALRYADQIEFKYLISDNLLKLII